MLARKAFVPKITAKEGGLPPPPIWRSPILPNSETNALHFGARMVKNGDPPNGGGATPFFCCNLGYCPKPHLCKLLRPIRPTKCIGSRISVTEAGMPLSFRTERKSLLLVDSKESSFSPRVPALEYTLRVLAVSSLVFCGE